MGFSVLIVREMRREPFFARSFTLVPRSLLLNRTETLATHAIHPTINNTKGNLLFLTPLEPSSGLS